MPFFSIIIPLFNKQNFIADTLRSVLAQRFTDYEVIVVNDGSTDDGESVVQSFDDPRIQYYLRENKGVSAARNFGIAIANAPWIAFLDADDYWYPDFLQLMHRNINRFNTECVFATAIEIETARNVIPASYSIVRTSPVQVVDFFKSSDKECVIWTSSAVFHKTVFEMTGTFDTTLRSGEDTDLWIRIGLEFPVVFDWKIQARYNFDPGSLSRDHALTKLNFSKFKSIEKQRPEVKKYLDLNRYSLAMKTKLNGDQKSFKLFADAISTGNLTLKKRILLHLPRPIVKLLLQMNFWLADKGLSNSVFR